VESPLLIVLLSLEVLPPKGTDTARCATTTTIAVVVIVADPDSDVGAGAGDCVRKIIKLSVARDRC
jgi:hypothetical protein